MTRASTHLAPQHHAPQHPAPQKESTSVSRFTGKVAVITGAAQGIGAATAQRLAEEGAAVAVVDLTAERAQGTADAITAKGGTVRAYGCDVADQDAVLATFAQVVEDL